MNEIATLRPALPAATQPDTETLPQNIEAEQQLLGAILTNNDIYDRIAALVKADHFYDPFTSVSLKRPPPVSRRTPSPPPSPSNPFFEDDEGLKELGGPAYLVRLAGAAISSFAARDYAQMIYDLAVRRELIALGRDIAARAGQVEVKSEPREQITEAEQSPLQAGRTGRLAARLRLLPACHDRGGQFRQRRLSARRRSGRHLHRPRGP